MVTHEQDTRSRIIATTIEILDEVTNVDQITVRQIAERANVGIGLVNYHFKTKDNLLSIAIDDIMAKMATSFITPGSYTDLDPVLKIKTMLQSLYSFAEHHEKMVQFSIIHSLLNGNMQTPLFLIPILKEIFGDQTDEINLRIVALQILLPIQASSLNPSTFNFYSGIDLYNEAQRNKFIDTLVDNLLKN